MTNDKENQIPSSGEESTLFSAPAESVKKPKSKKNALKSQRRIIVIFAVVAVVILGGYIAFRAYAGHLASMYAEYTEKGNKLYSEYLSKAEELSEGDEEKGDTLYKEYTDKHSELREEYSSITEEGGFAAWVLKTVVGVSEMDVGRMLLPGEVMTTGDNILMFAQVSRDKMEAIDVYNNYGHYGFYYDEEYDEFFVTDNPDAPFNQELFSTLVVSTGYTVAIDRVADKCEDFSEYGLSEADNPAHYTVTTRDGISHTVYVGALSPTGDGYYARYEGRGAVYLLNTDFSTTVLAPFESLVTPTMAFPMAQSDYLTVKNFTIASGDDVEVMITYHDAEEMESLGLESAYEMLYPEGFNVNTDAYTDVIGSLADFDGLATLVYAPDDLELEKYGLLDPAHSVYYEYRGIKQVVTFSEKNENGNYYAYSVMFDLIAEVSGDIVGWLEWETIEFVDSAIFMMNIDRVSRITVASQAATRIYRLVGEKEALEVTETLTEFKPEVENFRRFYQAILYTAIKGSGADDLSADEITALVSDESNVALTLTIELHDGETLTYRFYPYSTRRALYTVNGVGEFYILRDTMTKIISDSEKVMTNTPIDAQAHS